MLTYEFSFGCEKVGLKPCLRRVLVLGIVLLFFGAGWMAVLSGNVSVAAVGATVYVDDDNIGGPWDGTVSHPYQNITSGLEHASEGDTVFVFDGMYNENVVVNKGVALKGDSKPVVNGSSLLGTVFVDVTSSPSNFAYGVAIEGFEILSSYHDGGYGIYVDVSGIEDLDDSSVNIGNVVVADNVVNSNSTGIFVYVGQVGYYMYGNSSVTMGDFRVNNNTIKSAGNGIEVEFEDLGCYMYNNASFAMGHILVNDNIINSSNDGIHVDHIDNFGS